MAYLDELYNDNEPSHVADQTVAAVKETISFVLGPMPRAKRALAGFRKARPPRSRAPLALELMAAIAMRLLAIHRWDMAWLVAVCCYSYRGPGDIRSLKYKQLIAPLRAADPLQWRSINLAPQCESATEIQEVTKAGVIDDIINLDLPRCVRLAFAQWPGRGFPDQNLPGDTRS